MLNWRAEAFDSEILGVPSFKIWLEPGTSPAEFDAMMAEADRGFFACFTPYDRQNLDLLAARGFQLVSVRVVLRRSVRGLTAPDEASGGDWRIHKKAELPALNAESIRAFADVIGPTSRYFKDPRIPLDISRGLYETWISNSLFRGLADEVLLADIDGDLAALHSVKVKDDTGVVDLVGVLPAFQGRGLGQAIIWAGLEHLRDRGVSTLEVVSEAENVPAVRTYERFGFLLASTEFVFHHHSQTLFATASIHQSTTT